jgi:hypothetical protein
MVFQLPVSAVTDVPFRTLPAVIRVHPSPIRAKGVPENSRTFFSIHSLPAGITAFCFIKTPFINRKEEEEGRVGRRGEERRGKTAKDTKGRKEGRRGKREEGRGRKTNEAVSKRRG